MSGETWVQTLHLNVKQAQILSYVYIFRGYIVSILQPLSPGNVNSQKIILTIQLYAHSLCFVKYFLSPKSVMTIN